jgi:hypothetical protein
MMTAHDSKLEFESHQATASIYARSWTKETLVGLADRWSTMKGWTDPFLKREAAEQ